MTLNSNRGRRTHREPACVTQGAGDRPGGISPPKTPSQICITRAAVPSEALAITRAAVPSEALARGCCMLYTMSVQQACNLPQALAFCEPLQGTQHHQACRLGCPSTHGKAVWTCHVKSSAGGCSRHAICAACHRRYVCSTLHSASKGTLHILEGHEAGAQPALDTT